MIQKFIFRLPVEFNLTMDATRTTAVGTGDRRIARINPRG